ncbi:hypothetical protein [Rhodococcus sp. IEGM1428]|uniref:hypothetical protein n=1 Tax=Rhodococcus sp. IEGM1428 TaxID=3392191 RepID=UPI003D099A26
MARKPSGLSDDYFVLSITRALGDQLMEALNRRVPRPLSEEQISKVRNEPGVYALWLDGVQVYVGKASKGVPTRLRNHLAKLRGRRIVGNLAFTFLYVGEDLEASAPEKMLIARYKPLGKARWNNSGIGGKDVGRRRDATLIKKGHFDALYPIDVNTPVTCGFSETKVSAHAVATALKAALPFLLRFDRDNRSAMSILDEHIVEIPAEGSSLACWLRSVLTPLPAGWQATALPGHVILYTEDNPDVYKSALRYWRSTEVGVVEVEGMAQVDDSPLKASKTHDPEDWDDGS